MNLACEHLSKTFGKTRALDDISFSLPPGSLTGFVGPNGAGKTTTLRILAGLELPDAGRVIDEQGVDLIEFPERFRARIGYMPDALPEARDVRIWEYLDFVARAVGLTGTLRRRKIQEIMQFTRLEELSCKMLSELSKGMKQRVAFARMLLPDPELLLLDEPTAGLDPRARVELRRDLLELSRRGKTIFLSSHILSDLEELCDRIVIIERGHLLRAGKLEDFAASGHAHPGWLLTLREPAAGWLDRLRALPGVAEATAAGPRQVRLHPTVPDDAAADDLAAELFHRHLPVEALERAEHRLESIFFQSTTGGVQ